MTKTRAALADAIRPFTPDGRLVAQHMPAFNALADVLGLPMDTAPAARLTVKGLQQLIGVAPDGVFLGLSKAALFLYLSNTNAPALTETDFEAVAQRWGVPVAYIKGVRKVEAPRGAFDERGRPSILFERHKFRDACEPVGRFNTSHPALSGGPYGAGGYGSFASQYDKLAAACALDPEAAFMACSWGAFQVLGENARALGYASAFHMAKALTVSEAAHLETFVRFVEVNGLVGKFKACRPRDPVSCQPFVAAYNGPRYRDFQYDRKLADAIAG